MMRHNFGSAYISAAMLLKLSPSLTTRVVNSGSFSRWSSSQLFISVKATVSFALSGTPESLKKVKFWVRLLKTPLNGKSMLDPPHETSHVGGRLRSRSIRVSLTTLSVSLRTSSTGAFLPSLNTRSVTSKNSSIDRVRPAPPLKSRTGAFNVLFVAAEALAASAAAFGFPDIALEELVAGPQFTVFEIE